MDLLFVYHVVVVRRSHVGRTISSINRCGILENETTEYQPISFIISFNDGLISSTYLLSFVVFICFVIDQGIFAHDNNNNNNSRIVIDNI
jgi:hypothetical protein